MGRGPALHSVTINCLDHGKARCRFRKREKSGQRVREGADIIGKGEHSILFVGANRTRNLLSITRTGLLLVGKMNVVRRSRPAKDRTSEAQIAPQRVRAVRRSQQSNS